MILFSATLALMSWACQTEEPLHSPMFEQIFIEGEGTFRGIFLQDDISVVKRKESGLPPLYEDPLGISYKIRGQNGDDVYIEYYTPLGRSDQPLTQISSIVVNVVMREELRAANLYDETFAHLSQLYGVPQGTYEHYTWDGILQAKTGTGMEIILKLDDSKNKITLNYISKP